MATEAPIKHDQLIEPNVFKPTVDSADVLLEKLSLLIGGFRQLAKITGAKINTGIDPKTLSDVEQLARDTEKLAEIEKGHGEIQKQRAVILEKIRQAQAQARNDTKQQIILENSAAGSINNLRAQLAQLTKEYNALSAPTKEQTKNLLDLRTKLKQAEQATGDHRRSVGDYGKAFSGLNNILRAFSRLTGIDTSLLQEAVQATRGATFAQKAYTFVVGESVGAMKAFRIALASTGVGLLVIGLGLLISALSDTSKETDKNAEANKRLREEHDELNKSINETINKEDDLQIQRAVNAGTISKQTGEELREKSAALKKLSEINEKFNKEEREAGEQRLKERSGTFLASENRFLTVAEEITKRRNEALNQVERDLEVNLGKVREEFAEEAKEKKKKLDDDAAEKEKKRKEELLEINRKFYVDAAKIRDDAEQQRIKKEADDFDKRVQTNEENRQKVLDGIDKIHADILAKDEDAAQRRKAIAENLTSTLFAIQKKGLGDSEADQKKRQQLEQLEALISLANSFYKNYNNYIKKGDTGNIALQKASQDLLAAKAFGSFIAGAFAEGVEDFKGKGTGTSDSNIVAISKGESVATAKGTAETPGLVTAINKAGFAGAQEWAMNNVFPKIPVLQDSSRGDQVNRAIVSLLDNRLKSLEETIKNKTEWTISENLFGEIVKARRENGINKVITVKNTPIIRREIPFS